LSQQEGAKSKPGWAAFFNLPLSADKTSEIPFAQYGDEMRSLFELSYARFYRLAIDVSEGDVCADPYWAEQADPAEILADTRLLSEVVVLGWIGLGMTVWGARNQDDKFGGVQVSRYNEIAREHALETTIERRPEVSSRWGMSQLCFSRCAAAPKPGPPRTHTSAEVIPTRTARRIS